MESGNSAPVVIPGDPEGSVLGQWLLGTHPRGFMPPAGSLPEVEVETILEWIRSGAKEQAAAACQPAEWTRWIGTEELRLHGGPPSAAEGSDDSVPAWACPASRLSDPWLSSNGTEGEAAECRHWSEMTERGLGIEDKPGPLCWRFSSRLIPLSRVVALGALDAVPHAANVDRMLELQTAQIGLE